MFARLLTLGLIIVAATAFAFGQRVADDIVKKCSSAATIPYSEAERRVAEKGPVEIPPLAKRSRIQGSVFVEVCVAGSGDVVSAKFLRGHPLLLPAAMDSAKKWRFQPSTTGYFRTTLEIVFSQGISESQIAAEEKTNKSFFAAQAKCREALGAEKLDEAVNRCSLTVEIGEKLHKDRANERRVAYGLLGHAYFGQRKIDEALRQYSKELEIAKATLSPTAAELAYAHHDVALATHALGRAVEAAEHYAKAEQTLALARDHIGIEELKPKYAETLKQIRENFLILLRQTNQIAAAAELEKRMAASNR